MCRLDELRVALRAPAIDSVVHAVEITPLPQAPAIALGVITVRGQVIPVVNLRQRFNLPARDLVLADRFVIVRTARRRLAVIADAVDGVFEHPETGIARPRDILPGIAQVEGIVWREDGIVFIHDLERFLSLNEAASLDEAMARRGEDAENSHAF